MTYIRNNHGAAEIRATAERVLVQVHTWYEGTHRIFFGTDEK